ncbi:hypothetical protein pb186bvf_017314 [Paramecium bursaria]
MNSDVCVSLAGPVKNCYVQSHDQPDRLPEYDHSAALTQQQQFCSKLKDYRQLEYAPYVAASCKYLQ